MSHALRIAALVLSVSVAACVTPPPPIGRDLPPLVADARVAFDQRVKTRFPVGSSERALQDELAREHFNVSAETTTPARWQYVARRDSAQLMCDTHWLISWNSSGGTIQEIAGEFGQLCP
jgi:hypothetical protein